MLVAIERMSCIDAEGVKLRGCIDKVDKLDGKALSVVSFKTDKRHLPVSIWRKNLQLTLYLLS